ncbi:hypothetical protein K466DRAFT_527128 [Polyporus arcularius HHB13444]|uniref:F-box domain-containing protein n=1 Tax=Polyporus arcularius HHB13444 TaxID=1314778 RepID=A0A5C3P8P0_9APHY|nr:hypothetical protein K466DRAFT_527128 [Polyporus arcularius HHB13444]
MPPGSVAALRRSSRLKAKAKAKTPSNPADASQGPEAGSKVVVLRDSDRLKRPVKRRRVNAGTQFKQASSATRDRARMGLKSESLSMLPDMPMDILYEVLQHVHPLDLLHLARTTKALRKLLMMRSALAVWRRARENVPGLPDCPNCMDCMDEPTYASFMFEPHCQICFRERVKITVEIMWVCRVRCCKLCFRRNFVELRELHAMFPPQYDALRPALMLRYHVMVKTPRLYFHKRDVDKLLQYLATLNHDAGALEAAQMKCEKTVKDDEEIAIALEKWHMADAWRKKSKDAQPTLDRRRDEIATKIEGTLRKICKLECIFRAGGKYVSDMDAE